MPPKLTFTKEDIINAAFLLVDQKGLGVLSARKVAEILQSSQAPIYSQFANVEQLKQEVLLKAKKLMFDYGKKQYTDKAFLNVGVGVTLFSRDHQHLFQALSYEKEIMKDILDDFLKVMYEEEHLSNLPTPVLRRILDKMFITTYGLADLISKGLKDDTSDQAIIDILNEIGAAVIQAELAKINTGEFCE